MKILLPQAYLIGLIGLLILIAVLVGRQLLKVRKDEIDFIKLEKSGAATSKEASDLYELASVQLRKRLYPQAVTSLRKALKGLNEEPNEAKALIENALGFALAAQDDFKGAVNHYKAAIKAKEDYPVALNNLAYAQAQLLNYDEAYEVYQKVLKIDPNNKTASKQVKKIMNKMSEVSPDRSNSRGF